MASTLNKSCTTQYWTCYWGGGQYTTQFASTEKLDPSACGFHKQGKIMQEFDAAYMFGLEAHGVPD